MADGPVLGCSRDAIDTPALCIDLDVMEANIARMAALCRRHGVEWRPHSKGHKSPEIARRQLAAGAIGVTCAKLGEAEVMADGGIDDLLIANQIVGRAKHERLVALAGRARPIVAVDHVDQLEPLSTLASAANASVRVLVEVDIGLERCGVLSGEPAVSLAQQIAARPGIELAGIMGYEGHLLTVEDPEQKERQIREALAVLVDTGEQIERAGLPCPIVSAGGTGSYAVTVTCPGVTEVQAGGLIFMDAFYRQKCQVREFDFALTLLTTVVSRPAPDRAIVDAGRKSQNAEIHTPFVRERDDIRVTRLSAEHGQLELQPSAYDLRVGDRLEIVPGYGDFTNVLHDEFYVFRDNRLEAIWPLLGRGKIR